MRIRKKITFLFIYLNVMGIIMLIYHEKILNIFDLVLMPVDQEICKNLPFQFSKC